MAPAFFADASDGSGRRVQVVGPQQTSIQNLNITSSNVTVEAIADKVNDILSALRNHGLIAQCEASCDSTENAPTAADCTDSTAINYNSHFSGGDGFASLFESACIYAGCPDSTATNYDSGHTRILDDDSCLY